MKSTKMIKEKYKGKTVQINTQIPFCFTLPDTNLVVENIDGARVMAIGISYLSSLDVKYTYTRRAKRDAK
jgi:hypothetical protein